MKATAIWKKLFEILPKKQKIGFFLILLILVISAGLNQVTPLAVGYLTDFVLTSRISPFPQWCPFCW